MTPKTKMPWFRLCPSEWARETRGFTAIQEAAYLRLLCCYHEDANGVPRPFSEDELPAIYRRAGLNTDELRAAGKEILDTLFVWDADSRCWHHLALDREIARYHEVSEARRAAVAKRWDKAPHLSVVGK